MEIGERNAKRDPAEQTYRISPCLSIRRLKYKSDLHPWVPILVGCTWQGQVKGLCTTGIPRKRSIKTYRLSTRKRWV